MGVWLLRRWLVKGHARGEVLEVATGTGRNHAYYDPAQCSNLTVTDASKKMLEQVVRSWLLLPRTMVHSDTAGAIYIGGEEMGGGKGKF